MSFWLGDFTGEATEKLCEATDAPGLDERRNGDPWIALVEFSFELVDFDSKAGAGVAFPPALLVLSIRATVVESPAKSTVPC
jgi:hypothetical protein